METWIRRRKRREKVKREGRESEKGKKMSKRRNARLGLSCYSSFIIDALICSFEILEDIAVTLH